MAMIPEEKSKAYDEALEKAKELLDSPRTCFDINKLKDIFPQLRESEDEKIYREIYSIVHHYYKRKATLLVSSQDRNKMLEKWEKAKSFLEKQKSAEPSNEELVKHHPIAYTYPSNANRDEQLKMALLALLNSDLIKVAGNKFTKQDLIEWVERIPTDKPAWSEEDENRLNAVVELLENTSAIHPNYSRRKLIIWLKSLRPQPKQEWSEEDETILDSVIHIITHVDDLAHEPTFAGPKWTHPYTKEIAWLKSLRPSWKPSEEQMCSLRDTIVNTKGYQYSMYLPELYEQLEKLM